MALLKVNNIHTYIGVFYIIQGVSFEADKNKATVLLGRNGAGKTTLLRTIMGMTPPKSGEIIFKGEEITRLPTYKIAQMGISYIPSRRRIFGRLSVEENLKLAFRSQERLFEDRLKFVLDIFPDFKGTLKMKARNLSGGQQKMLLIACAIISKNQLLLIDEPSEGLSPILVKRFTDIFVKLKEEVSMILVEQNFRLAREIGDVCYILDMGKIVHHGLMKEIEKDKELLKRHLGISI
jgi:branched-chain amino acid transport system ATP-binding protein